MPTDFAWQHPRSSWENPNETIAQHTNSPAFPWGTADLIAVHYTAAPYIPLNKLAYLRAIQHDYVTNRGYSIGYSAAVDQDGNDYQLRGVDWRAAANESYNHRTFALLALVDGADPLTDAAVAKVHRIVAWFRAESPLSNVIIVGHKEIGATACPGIGVQHQIESGLLEPLEDDDEEETTMIAIRPTHPDLAPGLFTTDGHPISPELVAHLGGDLVIVDQDHKFWDEATLHRLGEHARRLYEAL